MVEISLVNAPTDPKQAVNGKRQQAKQHKSLAANGASKNVNLEKPNLELIDELRRMIKQEYEANGAEETYAKIHYAEIMDPEAPFVCWRYLLHRNQNLGDAFELIKAALIWRKANNIDELKASDLNKDFWLQAPLGWVGKTRNGQDFLYVFAKNYRKPDPSIRPLIRKFCIYLLISWDRKHKNDMEKFVTIFDLTDTGLRNMDLDFTSWLVSIRDFIPTRFQDIYVVGIPFIVRPIIRLIISWLPEQFKNIVHCDTYENSVEANIDKDQLSSELGGTLDDTWRLAPVEAPWASETDNYSEDMMKKLADAVCFNISEDRLMQLRQMQMDHENSIR